MERLLDAAAIVGPLSSAEGVPLVTAQGEDTLNKLVGDITVIFTPGQTPFAGNPALRVGYPEAPDVLLPPVAVGLDGTEPTMYVHTVQGTAAQNVWPLAGQPIVASLVDASAAVPPTHEIGSGGAGYGVGDLLAADDADWQIRVNSVLEGAVDAYTLEGAIGAPGEDFTTTEVGQPISVVTVAAAGSGYTPGDDLAIPVRSGAEAHLFVDTVDEAGAVLTCHLDGQRPGETYFHATDQPTTGGTGADCTVDLLAGGTGTGCTLDIVAAAHGDGRLVLHFTPQTLRTS